MGWNCAILLSILLLGSSTAMGQDAVQTSDAAPESASDAAARQHFENGRDAYAAGRFEEALSEFREAFELSDRPALLYNIGASADRLSRDTEALEAFEGFLGRVPESELRPQVEARVVSLRADIAANAEREASARAEGERVGAASVPVHGPEVYEEWWFWTILGVGLVGGALALGLGFGLARRSVGDPLPGDDGLVVQTLELGRF